MKPRSDAVGYILTDVVVEEAVIAYMIAFRSEQRPAIFWDGIFGRIDCCDDHHTAFGVVTFPVDRVDAFATVSGEFCENFWIVGTFADVINETSLLDFFILSSIPSEAFLMMT